MGCSTTFAKIILFVFNGFFFLFGLATTVAGIVVLASKDSVLKLLDIATKSASSDDQAAVKNYFDSVPLINMAAGVFIAVGIFTLIVGFCGCCGAVRESKCLLTTYAICIGFILVLEIVGAILGIVYQSTIRNEAAKQLVKLQDKYFVSYNSYLTHYSNSSRVADQISLLFYYAQVSLKCCGVNTVNDVANSTSWVNSGIDYKGENMKTPIVCCELKDQATFDSVLSTANWVGLFKNPENFLKDASCPTTMNSMHKQSCFARMDDLLGRYSKAIIGVGIGIGLVEILGIVFACCLIRSYDDYKH